MEMNRRSSEEQQMLQEHLLVPTKYNFFEKKNNSFVPYPPESNALG